MAQKKVNYWIISVPRQNRDQFLEIKRSFQDLYQDCERFHIPGTNPQEENVGLRVGKFDSLITLSDEMRKLDLHCEATARKISNQYLELTEESKEVPKEFDVKSKGASPVSFLTKFQWEKARFSTKKSLPELTRIVEVGMAKIDAELRAKTTEYNALGGKLRQITQSTQGNLLSRDITKEIETSKFIESNYLTAIYVVVPTSAVSEWLKCYTDLIPDFVVPNTSELLCEEHDFSLFKVVLFKHVVDDFKIKAKEKRFIVRKYDPSNTTSEVELGKLKAKYEKQRQGLERWCQTNFGEAYFLWIHLKAIQCYVESILRYGLPADFDVILLQPKKEKITTLEKQLMAKYAHLEKMFGEDEEDEEGHQQQQQQEKYYPYVFLEVPTSFF